MGLRETMNEKPGLAAAVIGGIMVVVLIFAFRGSGGGAPVSADGAPSQAYFTDDDGKTWFADDARKVPPFDHGGKQAVQAYVYRAGGKDYVHYMRRYTPEAKKKLEEMTASKTLRSDPTRMQSIQMTGEEVKVPGGDAWIKASDKKYIEVIRPPANGEMLAP